MKPPPAPIFKRAILALGMVGGIAFSGIIIGSDPTLVNANWQHRLRTIRKPPSLFAAGSPAERESGALLSTKKRAARGPHERVLSEVRDREPPANGGDTFNPAADALPSGLAENIGYASTPSAPAFPGSFGDFPCGFSRGIQHHTLIGGARGRPERGFPILTPVIVIRTWFSRPNSGPLIALVLDAVLCTAGPSFSLGHPARRFRRATRPIFTGHPVRTFGYNTHP